MNLHYNLGRRLLAFMSLFSLCLQSCDKNIHTSTEKEKEVISQTSSSDRQLTFLLPNEEQDLKREIAKTYTIDEGDITFTAATNGIINNVFIVRNKNNNDQPIAVIKCYRSRKEQTIRTQTSITEKIRKDNGFPAPEVKFVFPTSKDLPIVCMAYCAGMHKELDDQTTEKVAELMAKLHMIPAPENTPEYLVSANDFAYFFKKAEDWEFTPHLKEIFNSINLDYLSQLPQSLIHGDLSISNLIFDENNNVAGVLDFDDMCKSYLLTDLTYAQVFHGFDQDGKLQEDKITKFLSTYNRHRKLEAIELDNFYNHLKLQLILTALILHDCVSTGFIDSSRFDNSKSNHDVKPEVLAQKAISIKDRSSIKIN